MISKIYGNVTIVWEANIEGLKSGKMYVGGDDVQNNTYGILKN